MQGIVTPISQVEMCYDGVVVEAVDEMVQGVTEHIVEGRNRHHRRHELYGLVG